MRALLIDPEQRDIQEIDFEGDFRVIAKNIGCVGSRPARGRSTARSKTASIPSLSATTITTRARPAAIGSRSTPTVIRPRLSRSPAKDWY